VALRTRKRATHANNVSGTYYEVGYFDGGSSVVLGNTSAKTNFPDGTQVTASENHPSWRTRQGMLQGDIGGDFSTERTWVGLPKGRHSYKGSVRLAPWTYKYQYNGACVATQYENAVTTPFPPSIGSGSNTSLDAWGAKAIAGAKPTNALVDLSTTLGELLSPGGLPSMVGRSDYWRNGVESALKSGADDYLQLQFGWNPILQDIMGFADVVNRYNELVKQYERDAGKVVRRKWSFKPISTESFSLHRTGPPYLAPSNSRMNDLAPGGKVYRTRKSSVERWFSGAFTYHLPSGYSSRNRLLSFGPEAQKLLGMELTPETLWNLSPWSWAVDWFTSAGDVVSNVSDWSTDGLVMRYGYIMEHSLSTDTYDWTGRGYPLVPSSVTFNREVKRRRRANPFGFGITWGGLSPRQLSIAAALGISKS
jgi:hypothetical protein